MGDKSLSGILHVQYLLMNSIISSLELTLIMGAFSMGAIYPNTSGQAWAHIDTHTHTHTHTQCTNIYANKHKHMYTGPDLALKWW